MKKVVFSLIVVLMTLAIVGCKKPTDESSSSNSSNGAAGNDAGGVNGAGGSGAGGSGAATVLQLQHAQKQQEKLVNRKAPTKLAT